MAKCCYHNQTGGVFMTPNSEHRFEQEVVDGPGKFDLMQAMFVMGQRLRFTLAEMTKGGPGEPNEVHLKAEVDVKGVEALNHQRTRWELTGTIRQMGRGKILKPTTCPLNPEFELTYDHTTGKGLFHNLEHRIQFP